MLLLNWTGMTKELRLLPPLFLYLSFAVQYWEQLSVKLWEQKGTEETEKGIRIPCFLISSQCFSFLSRRFCSVVYNSHVYLQHLLYRRIYVDSWCKKGWKLNIITYQQICRSLPLDKQPPPWAESDLPSVKSDQGPPFLLPFVIIAMHTYCLWAGNLVQAILCFLATGLWVTNKNPNALEPKVADLLTTSRPLLDHS